VLGEGLRLMGAVSPKAKARQKANKAWRNIKDRCLKPTHRSFARYGGRGITVCERWMSFENFLADMGMPKPGEQIDRIDNDGGYEPGNCRWTSARTNMNNRSNSRRAVVGDKAIALSEISELSGVGYSTIQQRVQRGWSGAALLDPPRPSNCSRNAGLSNPSCRLNDADVERIRDMFKFGGDRSAIASLFGIHKDYVRKIGYGRARSHASA
jgi:hypothetical protein